MSHCNMFPLKQKHAVRSRKVVHKIMTAVQNTAVGLMEGGNAGKGPNATFWRTIARMIRTVAVVIVITIAV